MPRHPTDVLISSCGLLPSHRLNIACYSNLPIIDNIITLIIKTVIDGDISPKQYKPYEVEFEKLPYFDELSDHITKNMIANIYEDIFKKCLSTIPFRSTYNRLALLLSLTSIIMDHIKLFILEIYINYNDFDRDDPHITFTYDDKFEKNILIEDDVVKCTFMDRTFQFKLTKETYDKYYIMGQCYKHIMHTGIKSTRK